MFPAFGVEAVRRAPAESRGIAMGAYTACVDVALGVSGPLLGLVASSAELGRILLGAALIVVGSVGASLMLRERQLLVRG